jgi:hypothetical protein
MTKSNIQIKITFPTNIQSMIDYNFFNFDKTLEHHKDSQWKPQTSMKKNWYFFI